MSRPSRRSPARFPALSLLWAALVAPGCALDLDQGGDADDLTSVAGVEHVIEYESFVYLPAGADDGAIRAAIQRQVKSSLGALRERGIGVKDRDALHNLDPASWRRARLAVDGGGEVDRVIYRYRDVALVERDQLPDGPVRLTLLFGDYVARAAELVPPCADEADAEPSSLWYHFAPGRPSCQAKIAGEEASIAAATAALADPAAQIAPLDRDRRFVTTLATLTPVADAPERFPEYDRLWGFRGDPSRTKLVVYAFFGVDKDLGDPADWGLRESLRFQRTMRKAYPGLRVVATEPFAMLLDVWLDGARLEVTFDDVERWVLDGRGWPAAATTAAQRRALLDQVVERFSERWIVWQLPVRVTLGGAARDMTLEVRTFYGYEDGSPEARQRARWRYLEAFWHADVFAYTGHSHFGFGPLDPFLYEGSNFADRYQVMLVNSCLSFNYYDQDFLDMHPGGSAKLDVVVNGLPAYWRGMGEAAARYVIGLTDGKGKSWRALLGGMRVDLPWQAGYDPMRAVNGELDNAFAAAAAPLAVTPR